MRVNGECYSGDIIPFSGLLFTGLSGFPRFRVRPVKCSNDSGFSKTSGKRSFFLRNGDEVNMICHETPGENFYPETLCLFLDKLQVAAPIRIALENSHRADTPLSEVVRITDGDYSR